MKDINVDEVLELLNSKEQEEEKTLNNFTVSGEYGFNSEEESKAKKIDLKDLTISASKTEQEKTESILSMIKSKPLSQFVATQSTYYGTIEPLTLRDFMTIFNSNLETLEGKKMLVSTIYKKIKTTSCTPDSKMSFETWKENTSLGDLQSFYYALYCATFPDRGSFSFICPKCGNQIKYQLSNESLIQCTDNEYILNVRDLIKTDVHDLESMKKYSLLNEKTNDTFMAPSGDLAFMLSTPSIKTRLGIYEMIDEKTISAVGAELINEVMYIKNLYTKDKTTGEFIEHTDKKSILAIMSTISPDDQLAIREEVYKRMEEQYVYYAIKNTKCDNCNHQMKEIALNMEHLLFTLIFEKAY